MSSYILPFDQIGIRDVSTVGGKCASLGEMFQNLRAAGIRVPDGFAITTAAYRDFIRQNGLASRIAGILDELKEGGSNLHDIGHRIREAILAAPFPDGLQAAVAEAYTRLICDREACEVAVRSSATAEDLETASFAGQQETYLNVQGEAEVVRACHECYASLFTDRAIEYRQHHGFAHMEVELSIGVQRMVRSDLAASGVGFTIDPETGFDEVMLITGACGLGETVVQGAVNPDEFVVYKPALRKGGREGGRAIIRRKLGDKEHRMIYAERGSAERGSAERTLIVDTAPEERERFVLSDDEVTELANWMLRIEEHYGKPMDIEWAKDGKTGELFIVQARPETVRSQETSLTLREYRLEETREPIVRGIGVGNKAVTGKARILSSPREASKLKDGEILITDITSPDWDTVLKRAGAMVTNKGGRTSHAAIVARELGALAVVGTNNATDIIEEGQEITVYSDPAGAGLIYGGAVEFSVTERDLEVVELPKTKPMFILADPDQAFRLAKYPNQGVGLLRLEFIINNWVRVHPMALVKFDALKDEEARETVERLTRGYDDKREFFVERLAEGVATIAAAFYPKDVIVRMSDFKTNEYANLVGGREFEPREENPMLGFRGASRYYHPNYCDGFALECRAMKRVRDEMGLTNVKLMIPFCRTPEEGEKVIDIMARHGLRRGENGLEVYVMAELPSNVILAEEFAKVFDGFSVGSNDLTQLTLGLDRDSGIVTELFDETSAAPKAMIREVIQKAKRAGKKIGLCGQAASDHPSFAQFLVEQGIDSISFNPDAIFSGIENILAAEQRIETERVTESRSLFPDQEMNAASSTPVIEVFWPNGEGYSRGLPQNVQ